MECKILQKPIPVNSFIYRYCRKTKAERSYKNAVRLLNLNISTPQPIAYIIEKNLLGIHRSYYISQQIAYDHTLGDLFRKPPQDAPHIIGECIKYINSFHRKGVYFLDLSVGNILIKRQADGVLHSTLSILIGQNSTTDLSLVARVSRLLSPRYHNRAERGYTATVCIGIGI